MINSPTSVASIFLYTIIGDDWGKMTKATTIGLTIDDAESANLSIGPRKDCWRTKIGRYIWAKRIHERDNR